MCSVNFSDEKLNLFIKYLCLTKIKYIIAVKNIRANDLFNLIFIFYYNITNNTNIWPDERYLKINWFFILAQ